MNENAQHMHNLADNGDEDSDVFDFEGAIPNPFAERYRQGVAVRVFQADGTKERYVRLDNDVAERFSSPTVVNEILRSIMKEESGHR
jgi:hypothetical protein